MSDTIKCVEVAPGILIEEGYNFPTEVAKNHFGPLVGKTIKNVVLQSSEDSRDPMIVLEFEQGGAAVILQDPEGNGPGFIEYTHE